MESGRPVVVSAPHDKLSPPRRVSGKFDVGGGRGGGEGGGGEGGGAGGGGEEAGEGGAGGSGGGGNDTLGVEIENVDVAVGAAAVTPSGSSAAPVLSAAEGMVGEENVCPASAFESGGEVGPLEAVPGDEVGQGKGEGEGRQEEHGREGKGEEEEEMEGDREEAEEEMEGKGGGERVEGEEEGGDGQEGKGEDGEVEKRESMEEKEDGKEEEKENIEVVAEVSATTAAAAAAGDVTVGGDVEAGAVSPPAFIAPRLGEGVVTDRRDSRSKPSGRRRLRRGATLGKAGGSRLARSQSVYDGMVSGGEEVRLDGLAG